MAPLTLKIVLPQEIRAQLDKAVAKSGNSLGEEIRVRLQKSFDDDQHDDQTRELAADIVALAEDVKHHKRFSWHGHEKAREAFFEAIKDWLAGLKPPRDLRSKTVPGASDLMWGDDDPATLGRSIARARRRFKAEIKKNTEELRKRHEGKLP
jgi:hypothetical protein